MDPHSGRFSVNNSVIIILMNYKFLYKHYITPCGHKKSCKPISTPSKVRY